MGNIPNQNRHLSRHSNAVRSERSFFEIPSPVLSPFVAIDALSTLNFVPDISHISELGVFFPFFLNLLRFLVCALNCTRRSEIRLFHCSSLIDGFSSPLLLFVCERECFLNVC